MTDHPKPIARYALPSLTVMHRHGVKGDGVMFEAGWRFVLEDDHEAALAAKDARIAELETRLRVSEGIIEAKNEALQQKEERFQARAEELRELRTAIEAKAWEWIAQAEEHGEHTDNCDTCYSLCHHASFLLALLEKKP